MTRILTALLLLVPIALASPPAHPASKYVQEREGNPSHQEPTKHCSHHTDGIAKVACSCHQGCEAENDKGCKSYCFKAFCDCVKEECD
jgi:hypothetical protein